MLRMEVAHRRIKMIASYKYMTSYIYLISMNFRWTVRADAISGITTNYRHLLDLFGSLTKETDLEPEVNGRTVGAKFMLLDASTYYGKLFIRIMSLLHTGRYSS